MWNLHYGKFTWTTINAVWITSRCFIHYLCYQNLKQDLHSHRNLQGLFFQSLIYSSSRVCWTHVLWEGPGSCLLPLCPKRKPWTKPKFIQWKKNDLRRKVASAHWCSSIDVFFQIWLTVPYYLDSSLDIFKVTYISTSIFVMEDYFPNNLPTNNWNRSLSNYFSKDNCPFSPAI